MRRVRRAAVAIAFGAVTVACVDLFHSTDFETLCVRDPSSTACLGSDGSTEGADANRDGPKPRPDFCTWSSPEAAAQAGRACAWLGACEGPLGSSRFGECLVTATLAFDCQANPALRPRGKLDDLWACLATVSSCAEVDRCVFPAGKPPCTTIDAGAFTTCGVATNEAVRVECAAASGARVNATEPCLLTGRTCAKREGGDARSDCARTAASACTPGAPTCEGSSVVACGAPPDFPNVDRGFDCAFYGGGACVIAGNGAACTPAAAAPSCTAVEGRVTCEGTVARVCVGGREIAIDCAKLGAPCDIASKPVFPFRPFDACTSWDNEAGSPVLVCADDDACDGATIVSCANGARRTFDCARAGLGPCQRAPAGAVACSPP